MSPASSLRHLVKRAAVSSPRREPPSSPRPHGHRLADEARRETSLSLHPSTKGVAPPSEPRAKSASRIQTLRLYIGVMVDTLTPRERSERMSRVRGKDTKPEKTVRQLTHAMGFRYRLHRRDLPGRPDLVFVSRRKVIFVHGCFWHRHRDSQCTLARLPKTRRDFWIPKLEGNASRDTHNEDLLRANGWDVMVIWECELKDVSSLKKRIRSFLR